MVLQTTGPISLSQIRTEYNKSGSISLAGARSMDNRVPQSSQISIGSYLGKNYYPTSGLQLWLDSRWQQSYSGTGNMWNDMSGNSRNFTMTGVTFDSVNKRLIVSNGNADGPNSSVFNINTDHTVEIVCQPTVLTSTTFMQFTATTGERMILTHIPWSDSNIYYDVRGCCDATMRVYYTHPAPLNLRHYVLRTQTSTFPNRQIFENNVSTVDSGTNTTSTGYTWGGTSTFWSGNWTGYCYLIRIWNRALSNTEITQSYNSLKALYGLP
jgi:hypothetical protein